MARSRMTLTEIIEHYTPQSIKNIIEEHERNQTAPRLNPRRLP